MTGKGNLLTIRDYYEGQYLMASTTRALASAKKPLRRIERLMAKISKPVRRGR